MSCIELSPAVCVLGGGFFGGIRGAAFGWIGALLGAICGAVAGLIFYFVAVFLLSFVLWAFSRLRGENTSLFPPKEKRD